MNISSRVKSIPSSITLKLNEKAVSLAKEGKKIYNLTAGQLPFKPAQGFIDQIISNTENLKSYQYAPVAGFPGLRKQIVDHTIETRKISFEEQNIKVDCILSNGGKHSLSNTIRALVDHGDEVILLAPYWISYPEIIKISGAIPVIVESRKENSFMPSIDDIAAAITSKTKVIIVNSPNNPTGLHYSESWMKEFAAFLKKNPKLTVISDEIYFHLTYAGEKRTYFYQHDPSLLKQTVILDGISKSFSCTGLRLGYAVGPKDLISAMSRLQAQTASGANSLIQLALQEYGFDKINDFLGPVRSLLQDNAKIIEDKFKAAGLDSTWYRSCSAFYFMVDFTTCPSLDTKNGDMAVKICEDLLEKTGVAGVPTTAFGFPNAVRISLVLATPQFSEAIDHLIGFLTKK